MAAIDISSTAAPLNDGVLQLQNGVAMDSTLRNVADQNDTTSPLKLSTTAVQVVSPLRITTDDPSDMYLDCEDGATNNRFNITRNTASQQVNLNFASNPAGSTTIVGAIRTYVDGVNLSEVMTFREDGFVGLGTTAPIAPLNVYNSSASVSSIVLVEQDTAAIVGQINQYRKNGSVNLVSGAEIGRLSFGGYFNSTYSPPSQVCSAIYGYYGGTGTDRVGGLRLITWNGGGASTRLQVAPDGKIGIGTTAASAKLQIVGDGSTSATTSLLVQNSSGNRLLEQKDNGHLYIGNTASDTGVIYVPHSPTYVDRVFMRIDGGFPLFSTISNALLEISCAQFYTQGDMTLRNANTGIIGVTASNINNSSIKLTTQVNAYNGTSQNDACNLLYLYPQNITLQASGSVNWIKMDGNVYEAGGGGNKWCTGIYYNPSFTGGTLLANSHYCYHATSGQMMVNTTSPNASAQLQVDSTTRGFLPPRMTNAERAAITTPAIGLMVYCTDAVEGIYVYKSTGWTFVA